MSGTSLEILPPTHYNLRQNIQVIAAPLFSFIVKHYTQMISLLIGQCERHLILCWPLIGQISLLLSHITQMITAALLTDKRASPALEIQTHQFAELSLSFSLSHNIISIKLLGLMTHYSGIFHPLTSFKFTLKKFHCSGVWSGGLGSGPYWRCLHIL